MKYRLKVFIYGLSEPIVNYFKEGEDVQNIISQAFQFGWFTENIYYPPHRIEEIWVEGPIVKQ